MPLSDKKKQPQKGVSDKETASGTISLHEEGSGLCRPEADF
jgi:hypothetical protein